MQIAFSSNGNTIGWLSYDSVPPKEGYVIDNGKFNPIESIEIQQMICQELVKSINIDWVLIRWEFCSTVSISQGIVETTGSDGRVTGHTPPPKAVRALKDLREKMRDASKGTWFTAVVAVDEAGKYTFSFDYEKEPAFDPQVTDGIFATDFEYYPRSTESVPDWLKRKLDGARTDRDGVIRNNRNKRNDSGLEDLPGRSPRAR